MAGGSTEVPAQSSFDFQGGQGNQGRSFGQNRTGPGMNQPSVNRNWDPGPLSPPAENQPDNQTQHNQTWPPGSLSPESGRQNTVSQSQGQSRASKRALLRQERRQAGFRNIRILDAAFLVQARTGSGQQVIMVVNPPEQNGLTTSSTSGSDQGFNPQGLSNPRPQVGSSQNSGAGSSRNQLSDEIMTPRLVGQDRIRSHPQLHGFSNISDLTQDGNTYTGTADWHGEQGDLRVDGRNGFVIEPSHGTPSQVRTMLNEQGWNIVGNIQQQGTSCRVQASRNGTPYNLLIDAGTGESNRQTASTSEPSGNRSSDDQQYRQ
ncbi:hypothetical protein [Microvirga makkahensis]|uniref:Uncharacterized protein n=1 Tax=Microvirga makkahensis TaxID=1128670 RepID=A0A7X3MRJ9_9HYPH|nr:hypothetical protein [Microvirga makkahensis]MXQ11743.1 hypothetical protein [Microvirga makkahensis]